MKDTSKAGTLNTNDWKQAGRAALVWSIPVLLLYVSSVLAILQMEGHTFDWSDLIPSKFTTGSIVTWFFMQVQGVLLRLASEGKQ